MPPKKQNQSVGEQLELALFDLYQDLPKKRKDSKEISHTIDYMDTMPWWISYGKDSDGSDQIDKEYTLKDPVTRELKKCKFTIKPGSYIENPKKPKRNEKGRIINTVQYCGEREMTVESVLRYMMVTQSEILSNNNINGVVVLKVKTHEILSTLHSLGRTMNVKDLITSLTILSSSMFSLEMHTANGKKVRDASLQPIIRYLSDNERLSSSTTNPYNINREWTIQFNDLTTISLKSGAFRSYHLATEMHLSSKIGKWLFRQMHIYFRNAQQKRLYSFSLNDILNQSGTIDDKRDKKDIHRNIVNALREFIEKSILTPIYDSTFSKTSHNIHEYHNSADIKNNIINFGAYIGSNGKIFKPINKREVLEKFINSVFFRNKKINADNWKEYTELALANNDFGIRVKKSFENKSIQEIIDHIESECNKADKSTPESAIAIIVDEEEKEPQKTKGRKSFGDRVYYVLAGDNIINEIKLDNAIKSPTKHAYKID